MSIEVLTGLPGSGKTTALVEEMNSLRNSNLPVFLFVPRARETEQNLALTEFGVIATRAGKSVKVDHFSRPPQIARILQNFQTASPTTLLFDEAQYFGEDFVPLWISLARAGHRIVIATPSQPQLNALRNVEHNLRRLHLSCNLMGDGEATEFFVVPDGHTTLSVCARCADVLRHLAMDSVRERLIASDPHPGEPVIYQPINLDDARFTGLRSLRPDTATRTKVMLAVVAEELGAVPYRQMSYLDVGCNTGFFCQSMASIGFRSTGVDVVANDINVAKTLDSWIYRSFSEFVCRDAAEWLMDDERTFDVVSCFSVFQWLYIQHPAEKVEGVIQRFLTKVDRVLFFEMGYGAEAHYAGTPAALIDREWVMRILRGSGLFRDIRIIPAGEMGLKRDFFIALRG
jgi:SAM-dependent methyltransferase